MMRPQSRPARSLASGTIITIALQIYRQAGNRYFLISLIAHAWFFLIGLGLVVGGLLLGVVGAVLIGSTQGNFGPVLGLLILLLGLGLPLFGFGLARFTASGGLLSRLMFNVLRDSTEDEAEVRRSIYPRLWSYLWTVLGTGLILLFIYLAWGAFGYLLYLGFWPLINSLDWGNMSEAWRTALILIILLLVLGVILVAMVTVSYVAARLSLVDAILAIEPELTTIQAIQRSWRLTQGQAWHTLTVFFIASILVIPANLAASLINAVIVIPVAGFFAAVLLLPIWQGIKAVMYYDLRVRNEGLSFRLQETIPSPMRFMRRVILQTPESIELDFALAGIGSRALAWVVDQVILYVGLSILAIVVGYLYFYGIYPFLLEQFPNGDQSYNLWALGLYLLINYFIYNGYYIYFESAWQGQTPGKRLAEIRVVQDNGKPISLREAALRSFLQTIDIPFFGIGVFLVALTPAEKRLGDMVAGTLVIQDEQATRNAPTGQTVSLVARELAPLIQNLPGLGELQPDHYLLVRNFLLNRQQLKPAGRFETSQRLHRSLQELLFVQEDIPFELAQANAEEFIEAVYLAYRQQQNS
ncbi:RDD family protein [Synechococcus sp. PCC 6312]|uniref:RDD family protein n=1 Tax=Synechococcus sp. (strain ATCC 27167 / PCC 6312) TaxID=195253 RepID=UPI00029F0A3B|nr:RDD family protein [Synechococcus sp. PCC 6312]AFY62256.1 putative membrane protein/domain protein [Synechococcus sp. PCC 6312]